MYRYPINQARRVDALLGQGLLMHRVSTAFFALVMTYTYVCQDVMHDSGHLAFTHLYQYGDKERASQ